jgi:hypothetical protein
MRHEAKIEDRMLVFAAGKPEPLYLDGGNLAESCLVALYDHHQCSDDFGPEDEILVDGVWRFGVLEVIHVTPADAETRAAVLGLTAEKPYRISYDGMDGRSSESFATLSEAADYVRGRWEGADYVDGPASFHNDYGRFHLYGFNLRDIFEVSQSEGHAEYVAKKF